MNRARKVTVDGNTSSKLPPNLQVIDHDNIFTCSSLCRKALESILAAKSPNSAVVHEIRLWQQVRGFKEEHVIRYLSGFYNMLSDLLRLAPPDPYFTNPNHYKYNAQSNLLLIYNVTVRLGDICRYLHRHQPVGSEEAAYWMKLASSHYYNAHSLIPSRSHALHQLALIATSDPIVQIYWYVRAIHAEEEPLLIASSNLSQVVKRHAPSNGLIVYLFQKDLGESFISPVEAKFDPKCIDNWLIVAILAIHCDRVMSMLPTILKEAIDELSAIASDPSNQLSFHPTDKKRLFQALEVVLSYLNSQKSCLDPSKLHSKLESLLQRTVHHILFILSQSDTFAITGTRWPGLSHDKELQGFAPLSSIHSKLDLKSEPDAPGYELILLMKRIRDQCYSLVGAISDFDSSQQKVAVTSQVVREVAASDTANMSSAKRSQIVNKTKSTCKEQFTQPSASLPVTPGTTRVQAKGRSRNAALNSIRSSE